MIINAQEKRQLEGIMSDPRWSAVEAAVEAYIREQFTTQSAKRATEFDTMWYLAEAEGGKAHLRGFFAELEQSAKEANVG